MTRRLLLWTILLVVSCSGHAALAADEPATDKLSGRLLFMAAASTTDAVEQIRTDFERLHPSVTVRVSYGASSALARQIEAGGGADLFLSASSQWSEFLAQRELVDKQRPLLSNELVIVVPDDSTLDIKVPADLAGPGIRRLALADAKAVPAGVYAKQALEKLKLWDALAGKVTGAADVRQALRFVETGAAQAGIVYATDAAASKKVRIVAHLDPKLTDPIHYPLVLLKHGSKNPAAEAFYEYLSSPASAAVFRRHGFVVLVPQEAPRP